MNGKHIQPCVPAYLRTCVPAYLRTCVPAYLRTCVPAYLRTCVPAYLLALCVTALDPARAQTHVSSDADYQAALGHAHIRFTQDITLSPSPGFYNCVGPNLKLDTHTSGVMQTLTSDGNLGRAALISGNLHSVNDLRFDDFERIAAGESGGALYVAGDVTNGMDNVHFHNNKSLMATGSGGFEGGGGFMVAGAFHGDMQTAIFTENATGAMGGGFYVEGEFHGSIQNSHFGDNRAISNFTDRGSNGGGLYIGNAYNAGGGFTAYGGVKGGIHDTRFENNIAVSGHIGTGYGGGAYIGGYIDQGVHSTQFVNNQAQGVATSMLSGRGGGLFTRTVNGGFHQTRFEKNTATAYGGGFSVDEVLDGGVNNSDFIGNEAGGWGGGFFAQQLTGGIVDTDFEDNKAGQQGGGFGIGANGLTDGISNVKFLRNEAAVYGGGAFVFGAFSGGVRNNTRFIDNVAATGGGGGLAAFNAFAGGIHDSLFSGNQAGYAGGGMYANTTFAGGIHGSQFVGNQAGASGGGLYVGNDLSGGIQDTDFDGNKAVASGGGFYANNNVAGGIHNSTFTNNASDFWGGGAYINNILSGGIHGGTFTDNTAVVNGGGLYVVALQDGIHDSLFADNHADSNAGALGVWSTLTGGIHATRFFGNDATRGGAIAGVVDAIDGSLFIENRAQGAVGATAAGGYGGAAVLQKDVTIADSAFLVNHAATAEAADAFGGTGGAILHQMANTLNGQIDIAASAGARTLFYGNTHNPGNGGAQANAIHFANAYDTSGANDTVVQANIATTGAYGTWAGRVMMFDGMSSQADGLTAMDGSTYSNVRVNVAKTGTNEWVLGSHTSMQGESAWDIQQGVFKLANIRYDSSVPIGSDAQVMLSHADSTFDLRVGAALVGQGTISASKSIVLDGNVVPERWFNVGKKADAIDRTLTAAERTGIDVATDSPFGHLTLASLTVTFGSNFHYDVQIDPNGGDNSQKGVKNDLITVQGDLTIDADAQFSIAGAGDNNWTADVDYTIIEATGAINNFANLDSVKLGGNVSYDPALENLIFLKPVTEQINSQTITFKMVDTGQKFNPDPDPDPVPDTGDGGLGNGLDNLDPDHPVVGAIKKVATPENVASVYDNLSGEIYASGPLGLLSDRYLRDSMNRRMQIGVHNCYRYHRDDDWRGLPYRRNQDDDVLYLNHCIDVDELAGLNAGQSEGERQRLHDGRRRLPGDEPLWVSTWGFGGRTSARNGSRAAELKHSGVGLNIGWDKHFRRERERDPEREAAVRRGEAERDDCVIRVDENGNVTDQEICQGDWFAGINAAYEKSKVMLSQARNSRTDVQALSLGAYAATHVGKLQLRAGVAHSWLDLKTRRNIWIPGVQGTARASYGGRKVQVFGEAAREFKVGEQTLLTPYLNLTHIWMRTNEARETGSPAALHIAARRDTSFQTTVGVRGEYLLKPRQEKREDGKPEPAKASKSYTSVIASVAWVHANNKKGRSAYRFAGTDSPFIVEGIALGHNTMLASAGVQRQIDPNTSWRFGYHAQIASGRMYHSINLQYKKRF